MPSLPQLKEGSPESSADDMQTPKQSPERDSEQIEKLMEEEAKLLGVEKRGPTIEFSCSPTSLKSLSQEEFSESKLSPGSQKSPKHDHDQSDYLKEEEEEAPSPQQELEASYDRTSKISEDTLSINSSELPPLPHSKTPSDADIGGGGNGGIASMTHSTRDLSSRALSSSTPLSVKSLAMAHSKAASDDATVMSSSNSIKGVSINIGSKMSSKSLNEINTLGVRPGGEAPETLKISTLVENRVKNKERLDADPLLPSQAEPEQNSSIVEAGDEDNEEEGEDRSRDLESTIRESTSYQASLDDTVISPTLRIKRDEPQAGKHQEEMNVVVAKKPSVGEDALFEMLGEREEEKKHGLSTEEGVSSSGGADETTTGLSGKDHNAQEEGEDVRPEDVLDDFDKILDLEEMSTSSSTANVEDTEVPASPTGAAFEDLSSVKISDNGQQPLTADEGKEMSFSPQVLPSSGSDISPAPHLDQDEVDTSHGSGNETVDHLTEADEDKEKSSNLEDSGENRSETDSSLETDSRAAALEMSTDSMDPLGEPKKSPERTFGPNSPCGKALSAEYTPSPDHVTTKSQEVDPGSMEELLGASSEVEVETKEEELEGESQASIGERQLSEDIEDHSRQISEEPQDRRR